MRCRWSLSPWPNGGLCPVPGADMTISTLFMHFYTLSFDISLLCGSCVSCFKHSCSLCSVFLRSLVSLSLSLSHSYYRTVLCCRCLHRFLSRYKNVIFSVVIMMRSFHHYRGRQEYGAVKASHLQHPATNGKTPPPTHQASSSSLAHPFHASFLRTFS